MIGAGEEQLPLVAFNLADPENEPFDEFDIAWQVGQVRTAQEMWFQDTPSRRRQPHRRPRGR